MCIDVRHYYNAYKTTTTTLDTDDDLRGAFDLYKRYEGETEYPLDNSDHENYRLSKRARNLLQQCDNWSDDSRAGEGNSNQDPLEQQDNEYDSSTEFVIESSAQRRAAEEEVTTDESEGEDLENDEPPNENDDEFLENETNNSPSSGSKSKKNRKTTAKWSCEPPSSKGTKSTKENIVKANPGPTIRARRAKSEVEAFLLFTSEIIIAIILTATNREIEKLRKPGSNPPNLNSICATEIRCFISVLLYRGLHRDIKNPTAQLWYDEDGFRRFYRACMDRNRFQILLQCLSFHDQGTIRREYATDRFARGRVFLDEFEKNCKTMYVHGPLVCLDETLRNHFSTTNCDFLVFMPDKPGQMGMFFYTLGDGEDRYFSRILPKVKTAMTEREKKKHNYDVVMEMTKEITGTGRNLTADRGFSSIEIAEDLFKKKLTYVGTIMSNRSGLPTNALKKEVIKGRDIYSSVFMWKKDSPVMFISYIPKKNKNVLMITTEHDKPKVGTDYRRKPEAIMFYNEQRCAVDVVNHMVKDCSSQSKTDKWAFALFTFLIDVAAINAQTILMKNLKKTKINRRSFLANLVFQLALPWLKHRYDNAALLSLKSDTRSCLREILKSHDPCFKEPEVPSSAPPAGVKGQCFLCLKELELLKGKERSKRRRAIRYSEIYCSKCNQALCTGHRAKLPGSLNLVCDNCLNKYAQMK